MSLTASFANLDDEFNLDRFLENRLLIKLTKESLNFLFMLGKCLS